MPRDDGPEGAFRIETGPLGQRLMSGMHRSAAALAEAGLDVIVDHVILEAEWVAECRRLWQPYRSLWVGVRCPLEVVIERERARRDRTLGQAEAQYAVVHSWGPYDLEVDTSVLSPDGAADRIAAAIGR